ncbi:MAG: molecular chaperone [Eggerthella lenta]
MGVFGKRFPRSTTRPWRRPSRHALCRRSRPARKQAKTSLSAAVEYTKLFVGAVARGCSMETMYRGENVTVGFGQATFEMRELLREAGLEVRNVSNQYEDHLGIGHLYLSSLCAAQTRTPPMLALESVADFIQKHPLSWVDAFRAALPRRRRRYFVSLGGWLELCSPGMPKRCACRRLAWITLQRSIRPWVQSPSPATVR